jgi:hypothetical protein
MLRGQRQQKFMVLRARFEGAYLCFSVTYEPGSGVKQTKWVVVKLNVDGLSNNAVCFGGTDILLVQL